MLLSRLKEMEEKVNYSGWEDGSSGRSIHKSIPEEMCAGHLGNAGQELKISR